jgi:transposase
MSEDIESQIRAALRTVAPGEEFSQRLVASVTKQAHAAPQARRPARSHLAWWLSAGLAASVVLAVGVQQHLQQQRLQQSGLEARREVMQALRVTSQKLNLAYEAVKSQSSALTDEQAGA